MFGSTKFSQRFTGVMLAASLMALPALATGATYYVDTAGNDANNGLTPATAWKTITYAAANVPAGTSGTPNIIMVAAGTYDETGNVETFPINFTNDYVALTGAGSVSTFIDVDVSAVDALYVDGMGFSVSGFTFENALDAIDIIEGGFTVSNNVFESTVGDGVHVDVSTTDLGVDVTVAGMAITGNTFKTTSDGVYIYLYLDFDYTTENLNISLGDLTISGNTFPVTSGDAIEADGGIYITDILNGTVTVGDFTVTNNTFTDANDGADIYYSITDMEGTQVTVGDFTVTNNTFTDGSDGFDFYGGIDDMQDCQVTVGDLLVTNNTFTNQSSQGIDIDYWDVTYIYGDSPIVLGEITIADNEITSNNSSDAIYMSDLAYIYDIYDDSTVTTGAINITDNMIYVEYYGLYMYFSYAEYLGEEYFDDPVQVTIGPVNITGNSITSNDYYGAYIEYYDIAYDTYGQSSVVLGPFTFSNNTVNSYYEALYYYVDYWGEYMYEDSSLLVNPITISNNTLNSREDSGLYMYFYEVGYSMYDNSSVMVKEFDISNNIISGGDGYGAYFYFDYIAESMNDYSSVTMSPFTLNNNTIYGGYDDGIYIEYSSYAVATDMYDYSSASLPDWIITNNSIDCNQDYYGLEFYSYSNPDNLYDYSQVYFGSMFIDNNIFNSNKDAGMQSGIYLYIEDLTEDGYGASQTTYGDITVTNNTIYNTEYEAIYVYLDDIGYYSDDRHRVTFGDIDIGNNMVDMADYGIYLELYYLYTEDGAIVTFGDHSIHDNTLTNIYDTGIYFYYYNYNSDPDDAVLTIGTPSVTNNTITGSPGFDDGIYFYMDNDSDGITIGTPVLTGNTVTGFDNGIYIEMYDQDTATLSCNYLENNDDVGLRFETDATGLMVSNNSFVDNATWGLSVDDGYTAVVNAENNWWGDKLGPGACASCNGVNPGTMGTVDYDPWLLGRTQPFRCGKPFPWVMFAPATTGMSPATP